MPSHRFAWVDLPVLGSAALMLAGGFLLMLNVAVGALTHGRYMKLCAAVFGVIKEPSVAFNTSNLMNGKFQTVFARQIGFYLPYQPLAIRVRNQIQYSLFGDSATAIVVIGKQKYLYAPEYITDYCASNVKAFMQTAPQAAGRISQMQHDVQSQGQTFLYVLTPSKANIYPEFLPDEPCNASASDRAELVPAWIDLLHHDGVQLADTVSLIAGQRNHYQFPLFPRGGAHWNQLASALAAQAIETKLAGETHNALIRPVGFTWRVAPHPDGIDMDLAGVMNLIWPLTDYKVPIVSFSKISAPPGCRPVRMTIIGGSFMWGVASALSHLPCSPHIVEYWYWSKEYFRWENGVEFSAPVDPAQRDADLQTADIIILEENEQAPGHTVQAPQLGQWLADHRRAATFKAPANMTSSRPR